MDRVSIKECDLYLDSTVCYCVVIQGGPVGELVQWTDLIVVS